MLPVIKWFVGEGGFFIKFAFCTPNPLHVILFFCGYIHDHGLFCDSDDGVEIFQKLKNLEFLLISQTRPLCQKKSVKISVENRFKNCSNSKIWCIIQKFTSCFSLGCKNIPAKETMKTREVLIDT